MKTAISIPDHTFQQAESAAQQLGISRSEFFTRAAELLIRNSKSESVTARLNASLERSAESDSDFATSAGRRALTGTGAGEDW